MGYTLVYTLMQGFQKCGVGTPGGARCQYGMCDRKNVMVVWCFVFWVVFFFLPHTMMCK